MIHLIKIVLFFVAALFVVAGAGAFWGSMLVAACLVISEIDRRERALREGK
jgi:hypothetical protein